jgi:hypothetical protein
MRCAPKRTLAISRDSPDFIELSRAWPARADGVAGKQAL